MDWRILLVVLFISTTLAESNITLTSTEMTRMVNQTKSKTRRSPVYRGTPRVSRKARQNAARPTPSANITVFEGRTTTSESPSMYHMQASSFRGAKRDSPSRQPPLVVLSYPPMDPIMSTSSKRSEKSYIPDKKFYEARQMLQPEASSVDLRASAARGADFMGYSYLPPSKGANLFPQSSRQEPRNEESSAASTSTSNRNRNRNRNLNSEPNTPNPGYLPQGSSQSATQNRPFQDEIDFGVPPPAGSSSLNPDPAAQSFIEEYGPPGHPNRGKSGASSGSVRPDSGGSNLPLPQAQNFIPEIDFSLAGRIPQAQSFQDSIYRENGMTQQQQRDEDDNSRKTPSRDDTFPLNQAHLNNRNENRPPPKKRVESPPRASQSRKPEMMSEDGAAAQEQGYKYSKPQNPLNLNFLQTQIIESVQRGGGDDEDDFQGQGSNDGYNYPRPKNQLKIPQGSENQNQYKMPQMEYEDPDSRRGSGSNPIGYDFQERASSRDEDMRRYESSASDSSGYDYKSAGSEDRESTKGYDYPVPKASNQHQGGYPDSSNDSPSSGGYEYPVPRGSEVSEASEVGYNYPKPASKASSTKDNEVYENYNTPAASQQRGRTQSDQGYDYNRPAGATLDISVKTNSNEGYARVPAASENKNYLPPAENKGYLPPSEKKGYLPPSDDRNYLPPSSSASVPKPSHQYLPIKAGSARYPLTPPPGAIKIETRVVSSSEEIVPASPSTATIKKEESPTPIPSLRLAAPSMIYGIPSSGSTSAASKPRQIFFASTEARGTHPMPILIYGFPFEMPSNAEESKVPSNAYLPQALPTMIYGSPDEERADGSNIDEESRTSRPIMLYGTPKPSEEVPESSHDTLHRLLASLSQEYGTPSPSPSPQATQDHPILSFKDLPRFLQVGATCTACKNKNSFIRMEGPPVMTFLSSGSFAAPGYFLPPRPVKIDLPKVQSSASIFNTQEFASDLAEGRIAFIGAAKQPKGFIIEIPQGSSEGGSGFSLLPTTNKGNGGGHSGSASRLLFVYTPASDFRQSRIPIGIRVMSQTGVRKAKSLLQSS